MARRWKLTLIGVTLLTCVTFYLTLHYKAQDTHGSKREYMKLPDSECLYLKSLILKHPKNKFNSSQFFAVINALQGCPWEANYTARDLIQSQLMQCCNASHKLMVTQENAPVGHVINYDAEKRTRNVTRDLLDLFPKTSPFAKPIRSCAVVGNGGMLRNSSCGADIDKADFVFRLNFPPLNWTEDVGTKTHLVTANPSIIIDKYGSLHYRRKSFINLIKAYGSSLVLMPAFSFSFCTDVSFRALYTVEDFDMKSKVVFFNPEYLQKLARHWGNTGLKFRRMSSGLMMASAALEVCQKVTLYGFWPFSLNLEGAAIPHHYYDNVPPKPGFHSMSDEFYQYLQMHSEGALQLKVGQCY